MAGHEGGILTFGKYLEEAFAVLMREREEFPLKRSSGDGPPPVRMGPALRREVAPAPVLACSRALAINNVAPLTAICVDVR